MCDYDFFLSFLILIIFFLFDPLSEGLEFVVSFVLG